MDKIITFVLFFIIIYILYYNFFVRPQVRKKKKKDIPSEIQIFKHYYKIDIDKIGFFRTLRILNFVNALMLSLLLMVVVPLKQVWLKFLILLVLIVPTIWFTYYLLAKYLRHLERKSDKNV